MGNPDSGSGGGKSKQSVGSASVSATTSMRAIALIRDWTIAARLAFDRNLSTNACRGNGGWGEVAVEEEVVE